MFKWIASAVMLLLIIVGLFIHNILPGEIENGFTEEEIVKVMGENVKDFFLSYLP